MRPGLEVAPGRSQGRVNRRVCRCGEACTPRSRAPESCTWANSTRAQDAAARTGRESLAYVEHLEPDDASFAVDVEIDHPREFTAVDWHGPGHSTSADLLPSC